MHLVNHEDLKAPLHRLVHRLLQQGLNLIHAAVGSRIELGVIHKTTGINIPTGLAYAARGIGDAALAIRPLAIQRLGQNAGHRGFAHTTRTCK